MESFLALLALAAFLLPVVLMSAIHFSQKRPLDTREVTPVIQERTLSSNQSNLPSFERTDHDFNWLQIGGRIAWAFGNLLLGYYWLFYKTTSGSTHNIGLLNDRLVGVIVGAAFMVSGAVFWSRKK